MAIEHGRIAERREIALTLACARRELSAEQATLVRETAAGVDGDLLLQFCSRHGLAPLTYWHVDRTCPGLQKEWLGRLGEVFQRTLMANLQLVAELRRVLELFAARDIGVLVYKGPTLAQHLYGHLGLRISEDLDLFIRRADLAPATACLKEEGYLPEYDFSETALAEYERHACESNFVEPRNRTLVELHWQVLPPALGIHFDEELLWDSPQRAELQGFRYLAPRPEMLLLALAAHAAKHRWSRISWLADVGELIRRERLDWDFVWSAAARIRIRRILGVTLLLLEELLGDALPTGALRSPAAAHRRFAEQIRGANLAALGAAPNSWEWLGFHLRLQDDWNGRLRFLARKLAAGRTRSPRPNPAIAAARAAQP